MKKDLEQILRERAARLARRRDDSGEGNPEMLLLVGIGAERFALPLAVVTEVVRDPKLAAIPLAPPVVAGVLQARGEVIPAFRLSRAVNLPEGAEELVALLTRRRSGLAALLVERVEDIRATGERKPAPPGQPHIAWMTHDLIPVLDPDRIFPEEMA